MAALGIDVSAAQGPNLDWRGIAQAGVEFAFLKATEGQSYVDPTYAKNAERAKAAGLLTGAYHYFWATRPAFEQANSLAKAIEHSGHELPPVVDFESLKGIGATDALYRLHEFVETAEGLIGRKLLFYTYPSFWHSFQTTKSFAAAESVKIRSLGQRDLWIANYGVSRPQVPWPWTKYKFWQFDGDGGRKLPQGIDADFNWFDGDLADLRAYCGVERDTDPGEPITYPGTPTSKSSQRLQAVREPGLVLGGTGAATLLRAGEGVKE